MIKQATRTGTFDDFSQLKLDERSLTPEALSVPALMRELSLEERPPQLLRLLVQKLEKLRSAKKQGWSRPWNKTGVTVFRTHSCPLDSPEHGLAITHAQTLIEVLAPSLTLQHQTYIDELLADPKLLFFIFYHNRAVPNAHGVGDSEYEGLTLSFGRKFPQDKTKRDRIDIILEDKRCSRTGQVDGRVDLCRVMINPFSAYATGTTFSIAVTQEEFMKALPDVQTMYKQHTAIYDKWKTVPERQWDHWSNRYIEYFGRRSFIPQGSSFL